LSVMSCGVISTTASAYTHRHKNVFIRQLANLDYLPLKMYLVNLEYDKSILSQ
jgi:hypothetical protein